MDCLLGPSEMAGSNESPSESVGQMVGVSSTERSLRTISTHLKEQTPFTIGSSGLLMV